MVIYGTPDDDILTGTAYPETINGLEGNDTINAGAGNDTLNGDDGSDYLDGGSGADQLIGGLGNFLTNDIYVVDNAGDVVTELGGGEHDAVISSITYTLPVGIEHLSLTGTAEISATGNNLNNFIHGNSNNNILNGLAGNDYLDGKLGTDQLIGGLGNDHYYVDNIGDVVTEFVDQGIDDVLSNVTYTLPAGVESLRLGDGYLLNGFGNTLPNTISGNTTSNLLDGGSGADTLAGGFGHDIYMIDNTGDVVIELAGQGNDEVRSTFTYTLPAEFEHMSLIGTAPINGFGNTVDNTIAGNTANNVLDGRAGADHYIGKAGNDTYIVKDTGDVITEAPFEGIDSVSSYVVTYTLPAEVENLNLDGPTAINGTGNDLFNTINGNDRNNILNGGQGSDTLDGWGGQDTLTGGGAGRNTFSFWFAESLVSAPDYITDFSIGYSKILVSDGFTSITPSSFSRAANSAATTLSDVINQVFIDANGELAGNQALGIKSAAFINVATNSLSADNYLVINDETAGFHEGQDLVIKLKTGWLLPPMGAIPVTDFFV